MAGQALNIYNDTFLLCLQTDQYILRYAATMDVP